MRDETGEEDLLPDEDVPKRRRGRPVRSVENGFAPVPGARRDSAKCGECPKWDCPRLWCPISARPRAAGSPACRYGTILIRAKRLNDRRNTDE